MGRQWSNEPLLTLGGALEDAEILPKYQAPPGY
jgi:hypothetical protein